MGMRLLFLKKSNKKLVTTDFHIDTFIGTA